MRQAFSDIGWLTTQSGACAGISLGYDRCAEHEWGIAGLLNEFGVSLPQTLQGIEDHLVTRIPQNLRFFEYEAKSKDKRRKGYQAALLVLDSRDDFDSARPGAIAQSCGLAFFPDHPDDKRNRPMWDLLSAWGSDSFAIHVRGEANIKNLREVYEAAKRNDLALATPWEKSFFRGGISFAIYSQVPQDERKAVAAKYAAHAELEAAVEATGIRKLLADAGKKYYALSPSWLSDDKKEVCFFLNPAQQDRYQHGWFTVPELAAWANEQGPIVFDKKLKEFDGLPANTDWSYRLLKGLQDNGISLRFGAALCWLDHPGGTPGLRLQVSKDSEALLKSGIHPFDEVMTKYAVSQTEQAVS